MDTWHCSITPGLRSEGDKDQRTSSRQHGGRPCDQEPEEKGLRPIHAKKVGFKLYIKVFVDFWSDIGRFCSFFEDLGPFFRPDLGEKLGGCYPLQAYINQRFLKPWGERVQNREMLKNC
jgi:hypothetical protein